MRVLVVTTLLALALPAAPVLALDPDKSLGEYTLDVWRVRDGLPGSWVRDVDQDPEGRLWIAALGGVGRYDGARIARVAAIEERALDPVALMIAGDGTVWVTPSLGPPLCVRGAQVGECLPPGALPRTVRVRAMHQDRDGSVLLATNSGFFRWSGGRLEELRLGDQVAADRVGFIHRDRRGRLWVGAGTGLYRQGAGGALALQSGPRGPLAGPAGEIFETASGRLWVMRQNDVVRIDGDDVVVLGHGEGLPSVRMHAIAEDRDGQLWIGSTGGLIRYQPRVKPPLSPFVTYGEAEGLPDLVVLAVFEDREGSLWIGTRTGGLAQLTDRTVSTRGGPPSLRGNLVYTLAEEPDGTMWFGSHGALVRRQGASQRRFTKADGLRSDRVFAVLPAPGGGVWAGTERGLARVGPAGVEQVGGLELPIYALYLDGRGGLWAGSDGRLLFLAPGAGELRALLPAPGFSPGHLRAIEVDDRGVMWAAGTQGLARVDGERLVEVAAADGVSLRPVRAIHRDRQGVLWMGTAGNGLVRRTGGRFSGLGAEAGVSAAQIYQVISDDLGFVWAGSSRGLLRLPRAGLMDVAEGRARSVEAATLEVSDERRDVAVIGTRQPSCWRTRDGRLWFSAAQGVLTVDPRRVPLNPRPPTVVIDEALVDGRPAHPGQETAFAPGPGRLELRFAAVTLVEPHKVRHRYRLEGFDASWVEAGTSRAASYTNIPPGRYRFLVQASNADGVWNTSGASVSFRLRPAFYRTRWFQGLAALVLAAAAWLLYRARLARLRREYLAVFAERTRVARELHDSLLQGMAGAAMQLHALRMQAVAVAPALTGQLGAIQAGIGRSLEETRRYLWDLREQDGGAGDLGQALGRLAHRISQEGTATVACEVRVEGTTVSLPHDVQGELFRITQEALTNAVKHAAPRRLGVELAYDDHQVRLTVSDDGQGFDSERTLAAPEGHLGLVGMRERASRIGASLEIDSRPGSGTTVRVSIPAPARG